MQNLFITNCRVEMSTKLIDLTGLNSEYISRGMYSAIDWNLFVIDLDIEQGVVFSPVTFLLVSVIVIFSVFILRMNDNNADEAFYQEILDILNARAQNNRPGKPVMDIVFIEAKIGRSKYFLYDKNSAPHEDNITPLVSVNGNVVKPTQLEIDGKLHNGVLRTYMNPYRDDGCYLSVRASVFNALSQTHDLKSNGKDLTCYDSKVIVYKK